MLCLREARELAKPFEGPDKFCRRFELNCTSGRAQFDADLDDVADWVAPNYRTSCVYVSVRKPRHRVEWARRQNAL